MHYLKFTVDQQQEQQKQQQQQQNTENVNEDNGPPDDWEPVMHIRENGPNPSDMAAYGAIYKKLLECTKADKKGWHHRPVYRVSALWIVMRYAQADSTHILYSKLGCNIASMVVASKLYNIWKRSFLWKLEKHLPAFGNLHSRGKQGYGIWVLFIQLILFSRPGKYFEYVHEYTMFLIQLCAECKDEECIRILKEKLSKTSTILLYSDEAITAADKAYDQIHHETTANQEPQAESSEQHNQEQQQSM